MSPLSNLSRRAARTAHERAQTEARSMPGNLLPHELLDELVAAAGLIVDEVERLPEAPYDLSGPPDHPVDATLVGLLVGRRLGVTGEPLRQLGIGLFLQDIGLLALPSVITEPGAELDEAGRELLRRHPRRGLDLLRHDAIGADARAVVRYHHERWDGNGYPSGLSGEAIPVFARIAALAEAFAEVSSQPEAVDVLRAGAGSAFDPRLVEVFADVALARSPGLKDTEAA